MRDILRLIENLKNSEVAGLVDMRIKTFKVLGRKSNNEIFKELCFCLLTANFSAERAIEIQKKVGEGFLILPQKRLASALQKFGYRYPNTRAEYIAEARKYKDMIKSYVGGFTPNIDEYALRDWLVKNIKGLGYKEASHFLRNIGYQNLAIIDFHIMDLLERHGLIACPKTLTKAKYLKIEEVLRKIARKSNLTLAELDLYLWYIETGKVLK